MSEVDLSDRFGIGLGCVSYDVVLNHSGVIRLQCSWRRGNSFSVAHEIYLYLGAGSLPLDLVGARGQLRATPKSLPSADSYPVRKRTPKTIGPASIEALCTLSAS